MSRLIVKNLPKSITSEKLTEIFGEKGTVTDVQLKYTKDGKFRHFGFIGFKTQDAAEDAVNYFNNTFINTSKITVELCAGIGDPKKPKAWSKYAADSTAFKKLNEAKGLNETNNSNKGNEEKIKKRTEKLKKNEIGNDVQEILNKHKDDPLFVEFMEAHSKGKKTLWSNDIIQPSDETQQSNSANELEKSGIKEATGEDSSDEISQDPDTASDDEEEEEEEKIAMKKDISDLEYLKMKSVKGDILEEVQIEDKKQKTLQEETDADTNVEGKKDASKPLIPLFTIKLRGLDRATKKKDVKHFFNPLKPYTVRIPTWHKGIAYVGFKTEKEMNKALMKHKSFLAGKRISVIKYKGQTSEEGNSIEEWKVSKWKEQENGLKDEETIAESGRIFVRNLSYTVKEADLEQLFSKYGPLTEVNLPVDRFTRKAKAFAIVTFVIPEHAVKAYTELDGTVYHGRMLHLLPGKAKKSIEELMEMEGLTYKQKKILKAKAEAASSHNWNTLFLGQNAIADIIAEHYNTSKEKVLDARGSESVAVRLALGETQIVSEIREFLLQNGVHLDAFNQAPKERSKTVVLAKNLPAKTTVGDVEQLFLKYGELGRVVMPPSGVTAIIEFLEPSEARNAFRKLAYSKFRNLPLYLEWAPSDTFSTPYNKKEQPTHNECENSKEAEDNQGNTTQNTENRTSDEEEEEDEPEPDTTLFIKGLNFSTREEAIKEHFRKCGSIHYVTVALKKDSNNPGVYLSLGYGFIQFKKKAGLEKALKTLQHSVLDGHSLELKRSDRTRQCDVTTARKKTIIGKQVGSKILVRNIPFQAHESEIRQIFVTFGELKAIRLPKKMAGTGTHRGFGFVEYHAKHDAKRAFKALCQSTHLYGRRLVLEWASTEEDIDELRKRTADHFLKSSTHRTLKKSRVDLDLADEV